MDATGRSSSKTPKPRRALLSHSTVLILSAFLIGLLVHHAVPTRFEPYLYGAGTAGLFAYLALDIVAARRRARESELAQQQVEREFENRMNRHMPPKSRVQSARPRFRSAVAWRQYVNVPGKRH